MLATIPKLVSKDYFLGFFLPSAWSCFYLGFLFREPDQTFVLYLKEIAGASVWPVVLTVLLTFLLLVTNRIIVRFWTGYGRFNPLRLLFWFQIRRFNRLNTRLGELKDLRKKNALSDDQWKELTRLSFKKAVHYPPPSFLLPTNLGNVVRAFESYPRMVYGLDAVPAWPRISLLMGEDQKSQVQEPKTIVDFWINNASLALIIVPMILIKMKLNESWVLWPHLLCFIAFCWISYVLATRAALSWGESVKACFDLYIPELAEKFGLTGDDAAIKNYSAWVGLSQMMIYGHRKSLERLPIKSGSTDDQPEKEGQG